jgi:hypothetical protein
MKTKTLLIAAVMFLGISVAAFAQATYTVSASPVPLVVSSGYAERVGSIGFSTVPESDVTVTGYIYIKYGSLRIANNNQTLIDLIDIVPFVDPDANLPGYINPPDIDVVGVEQDTDGQDTLVLSVYPAPSFAARQYSFRINGVRVDVTEWPATEALHATIFATENLLTNGEVSTTVLYGKSQAIDSLEVNNPLTLSALIGGSGNVTLDVTENFRNAFGKVTEMGITQNILQTLKFKLPNVPLGITLTFPNFSVDGKWTRLSAATVTGNDATQYVRYQLNSDSDVAAIEEVRFVVNVVAAPPSLTLYNTSLRLIPEVTLGPIAGGIYDDFYPSNPAFYVPRYEADFVVGDESIFVWEEDFNNTFLMVLYATMELGYNTGIAIANTTMSGNGNEDSWPMNPSLLQGGQIIFRFFDNAEGMVTLNSAALVGTSIQKVLDSEGKLPSGKSYVVLLSQLLDAAGFEGDSFTGYILINARFPLAHGQYFVSDFSDFTNGALMLVISTTSGTRGATGIESLGQ